MEQDFRANFQVNVTWFLPFSPVSLTESCSFWNGWKDLFTLLKLADKVVLDHKKTSGRRDVDLQEQLWAIQGQMG